jgi:hypothetical protein
VISWFQAFAFKCNVYRYSMIDYIILTQVTPFAAIAQQNKGWVGFLQNTAMDAIQCIRFNRTAGALYKFNPVYP